MTTHDIKDGYDEFYRTKFSEGDDWTNRPHKKHPRRWISSIAEKETGQRLIVGCGALDLKVLQAQRETMVGVDISKLALIKSKDFGEVILADATHLPFQSSSFDIVCAFDVLEHVPDQERMISEITRNLRKGGKLFLSVPIKSDENRGDKRQPFDEPPSLASLMSLLKETYVISLVRGFEGKNRLTRQTNLFPFLSFLFKRFPSLLEGSRYISLTAIKQGNDKLGKKT